MTQVTEHFYDLPLYYDIAFDWDASDEVAILEHVFAEHADGEVLRVLEPACGTGRLLRALATQGYAMTGYDLNQPMVEFAQQHTPGDVEVVQADMTTAQFDEPFDAALCPINSLGHLITDENIAAHLRCTGESLRSGGVYVIQLSSVYEDLTDFEPEQWTTIRDGVTVDLTWEVVKEDVDTRLAHHHSKLIVDHGDDHFEYTEDHTMRVWTYDDIKRLVAESGRFELAAIYGEDHEQIDLDTEITGETGNLYYVLKRV